MNQLFDMFSTIPDADEDYIGVSKADKLQRPPRTDIVPQRNVEADKWHQVSEYFAKFVPETVQRRVAANLEAPELSMHECDVSVLFIDISSYSSLSERMSPVALNTLIEQYFSTFLDCICKAGGDINEIAGDGLMAIFQSVAPQQHTMRAAAASLAILAVTEGLNQDNQEQPLTVHMGLNSGVASVGLTRLNGQQGTRWTFTARGPMTNLAARLADRAQPGQILVGPEAVRRLGERYVFQRLGSVRFKNIADPIAIYCLLRPSGWASE